MINPDRDLTCFGNLTGSTGEYGFVILLLAAFGFLSSSFRLEVICNTLNYFESGASCLVMAVTIVGEFSGTIPTPRYFSI